MTAPVIALRAWCRLVRAHRAAVAGGRRGEAALLAGRVELARARYRALTCSATAGQDGKLAGVNGVGPGLGPAAGDARVVRSAAGGPVLHRDSTTGGENRARVLGSALKPPRR